LRAAIGPKLAVVIVWILPSSITADTTDVVFAAPVVSLKKTTWPQGTPAYGSVAEDGYFAGRLGRRHHHAVSAREAARVEGMPVASSPDPGLHSLVSRLVLQDKLSMVFSGAGLGPVRPATSSAELVALVTWSR
jgi:hypothetical protein